MVAAPTKNKYKYPSGIPPSKPRRAGRRLPTMTGQCPRTLTRQPSASSHSYNKANLIILADYPLGQDYQAPLVTLTLLSSGLFLLLLKLNIFVVLFIYILSVKLNNTANLPFNVDLLTAQGYVDHQPVAMCSQSCPHVWHKLIRRLFPEVS